MADEKKQPTKEQIEKKRAEARESALKTFKGNYLDLAAAFFVDKSGKYGEEDASAVDQFLYQPAIRGKEGSELVYGSLLNSRQGGKRYTGNVSEYQIIQTAAKIVQESLTSINIQDILNLMSSKVKVRSDFEKGYIGDYLQSDNKEVKEFAQQTIGTYLAYLTKTKVAEALSKSAQATRASLEDIVKQEEPKKVEAPKGKK